MQWEAIFCAKDFPLEVQQTCLSGKVMHRVVVGGKIAGAVAVVSNRRGELLLVRQYRPAIDETLWELPRGMSEASDSSPLDTASRELTEETGFLGRNGIFLGYIYPDSGILSSRVAVAYFEDVDNSGKLPDGETSGHRWFTPDTLKSAITNGQVRDAMSLAALKLIEVSNLGKLKDSSRQDTKGVKPG